MLDLSRQATGEESFMTPIVNNKIFTAMGNQYILGLGEFNLEYAGINQALCWFIFLLSTMITLVVFMNMIIAQMGQTFSECLAKRQIIINKNRAQLIHEFVYLIDDRDAFYNQKYLYIAEVKKADVGEQSKSEMKLVQMQKSFQKET